MALRTYIILYNGVVTGTGAFFWDAYNNRWSITNATPWNSSVNHASDTFTQTSDLVYDMTDAVDAGHPPVSVSHADMTALFGAGSTFTGDPDWFFDSGGSLVIGINATLSGSPSVSPLPQDFEDLMSAAWTIEKTTAAPTTIYDVYAGFELDVIYPVVYDSDFGTTSDTPTVDAGQAQVATGPAPATVTLTGTFTDGDNNEAPTYLWTQASGPTGIATIETPTALETDITFAEYFPGTYVFQLTATAASSDNADVVFTPSDTVTIVVPENTATRVQSGSVQTSYPDNVTLTPVITDDGWGGALSYAWTQLDGPGAATINSPAAASTSISFPDVLGTYIFALTVTRGAGSPPLGTVGWWRVTVYNGDASDDDGNRGDITLLANGVEKCGLIESCHISEQNGQPSTCQFSMYGESIDIFNDVTLTRGGVRLFGGLCLSMAIDYFATHPFYHPSLVGYAWHLGRTRVTASFQDMSITDIAIALIAMAPGGLTDTYVADGLPTVDISFADVTIQEALNQLAQLTRPRAHCWVDYFKNVHFAVVEIGNDPAPITPTHPSVRNIRLTQDGSPVANKVTVHFDLLTINPALVDAEIQVDSLDGYSPTGGTTEINGQVVTYTSTLRRLKNPVFGQVSVSPEFTKTPTEYDPASYSSAVVSGNTVLTFLDGSTFTYNPVGALIGTTPPTLVDGTLFGLVHPDGHLPVASYAYEWTLSTSLGETPVAGGTSGWDLVDPHNAIEIVIADMNGTAANLARLTGVNFYRRDSINTEFVWVGTVFPGRGVKFLDTVAYDDLPTSGAIPPAVHRVPPTENTADEYEYFLEGVSGSQDTLTPSTVTVEDAAAQAALAVLLGGGDDGVVELSATVGTMSLADATAAATALLAVSTPVRSSFACEIQDDDAHPGQNLSVNFPSPVGSLDLKIQQVDISGFTRGIPHYHAVVAADEIITIEDLLRQGAKAS